MLLSLRSFLGRLGFRWNCRFRLLGRRLLNRLLNWLLSHRLGWLLNHHRCWRSSEPESLEMVFQPPRQPAGRFGLRIYTQPTNALTILVIRASSGLVKDSFLRARTILSFCTLVGIAVGAFTSRFSSSTARKLVVFIES